MLVDLLSFNIIIYSEKQNILNFQLKKTFGSLTARVWLVRLDLWVKNSKYCEISSGFATLSTTDNTEQEISSGFATLSTTDNTEQEHDNCSVLGVLTTESSSIPPNMDLYTHVHLCVLWRPQVDQIEANGTSVHVIILKPNKSNNYYWDYSNCKDVCTV